MEFEVVTRYQLPVVVIIINNNGIGAFNPTAFAGFSLPGDGDDTSQDEKKKETETKTKTKSTLKMGIPLEGTVSRIKQYSVKALTPQARYEGWAKALGARGILVRSPEELEKACREVLTEQRPFRPTIINVLISTIASRGKTAAPPWAATL